MNEVTVLPGDHEESEEALPDYADQLDAFHEAFAVELQAVIDGLPLTAQMRVLDVGCGDGFYSRLLAQRLRPPGRVIGLDSSATYLELARQRSASLPRRDLIEYVVGELADLPVEAASFDLVWCAQSLYSLPEPVSAVRQMAAAARPGGLVAILENDTLHQVMLPWPGRLEIALRSAEFAALSDETRKPGKYYIGHRLPAVLAEAGLEPQGFRTQCIDRRFPLDEPLRSFLQSYLERLAERVEPYLSGPLSREFAASIDPSGESYLLRQPWFTMSYLNVIVWGRRPE